MDTLLLTNDQRLRLALLDRCLPVAGVQAVPMAEDAYAFVVRGLAEAAPPPAMPTAHTAIALVPAPSMPVEKIDMDARPGGADGEDEEPDRHAATDMTLLAAIAGGHVTRRAIVEATGIPRGSLHRRLQVAIDAGVVIEDRSTFVHTYRLADEAAVPAPPASAEPPPPPTPAEPPAPTPALAPAPAPVAAEEEERLKREWLERNGGPSTKPNLGPHEEVVLWLRSQSMFVARLPEGTRGRYRWRYGDMQIDTPKLYQLANKARKAAGLPPIKMPPEGL